MTLESIASAERWCPHHAAHRGSLNVPALPAGSRVERNALTPLRGTRSESLRFQYLFGLSLESSTGFRFDRSPTYRNRRWHGPLKTRPCARKCYYLSLPWLDFGTETFTHEVDQMTPSLAETDREFLEEFGRSYMAPVGGTGTSSNSRTSMKV